MRDLAFHDNDLIVATHGRGFWVLDDISALRQTSADVVVVGCVSVQAGRRDHPDPPSTDNGTPTQKDEPEAENPPNGAVIDYYLKTAAAGPVTIEILNAGGTVIRRYSSSDPPPVVDVSTLAVNPRGRALPEPLSAAAGMHRWVVGLQAGSPPAVAAAAAGAAPAEEAAAVAVRRQSRRAPIPCA